MLYLTGRSNKNVLSDSSRHIMVSSFIKKNNMFTFFSALIIPFQSMILIKHQEKKRIFFFSFRFLFVLIFLFCMATADESTVGYRSKAHHLLPLSPRVPTSTDRHFEQYLIDHHNLPKLPSITKSQVHRSILEPNLSNDYFLPTIHQRQTNSINRLLNSEQYRRSHARLIEYRQHSKIPGVTLTNILPTKTDFPSNSRSDFKKEIYPDPIKPKQQNAEEIDLADDESVLSNGTDRKRRAKQWIKEHQFFFTEY